MKINFLTLFPKYFEPFKNESIIAKAIEKKIIEINIVDIRDFSKNKHLKVDDQIYGGGPGMLMQIEPIDLALQTVSGFKIAMSPQGQKFTQKLAYQLSKEKEITIISGRYEGFDERIIDHLVDLELSIGDYVLTGGELPAMVVADAVARLVEGVINQESLENESFSNDMLDFPQYTRPRDYKGMKVPEVLFSGNHKQIKAWKEEKRLEKTRKNRPDLLKKDKDDYEK
ncbi:tRNA (guanosine(37)-N1)-methyltransferase TrmD [Mesomycoplasma hyorhinis]|uniref:tRNA (guanine-N(1)-)-methyltransferase n=5 Tax=Mesomycoplasma hyorhinis TaxID=2100 RepID=A0AAJ3D793_MESHY|nr:tRNA (guanosine(37)-N1)-methyltransferase TrmD [Mesomycoplasma hyorhinis]ADM21756.1 tRNA (guanine-N(1)-)-methyltransferase [Mesomycoplasma hyorhinis HUB-1]AEC45661.1 tRNA (guanine-N(1)-)-methyltransferase [Mesomycoplasma hyorhinis MCLD]AFX74252.1 tRNA (Guanine37-N1) -methyltransferase [Mesomycoplasma hyorhinis SK76]AHA41062.1 tRNA (guanine(37)-N(1))-methyltransferase [Mesomycoplasma hyorhinis DBS 1050]AOD25296.1 tRNA (Guanine37-N1) -methyltransferase [Mesomycoplasma hyorhinis]